MTSALKLSSGKSTGYTKRYKTIKSLQSSKPAFCFVDYFLEDLGLNQPDFRGYLRTDLDPITCNKVQNR